MPDNLSANVVPDVTPASNSAHEAHHLAANHWFVVSSLSSLSEKSEAVEPSLMLMVATQVGL